MARLDRTYDTAFGHAMNAPGNWDFITHTFLNEGGIWIAPMQMSINSCSGTPIALTWLPPSGGDYTTNYLKVKEVWDIQQDASYATPFMVRPADYSTNYESLCRRLSDGSFAVLMLSHFTNGITAAGSPGGTTTATLNFTNIGFSDSQLCVIKDIWGQTNIGVASGSFSYVLPPTRPYLYVRISPLDNLMGSNAVFYGTVRSPAGGNPLNGGLIFDLPLNEGAGTNVESHGPA